MILNILPDYLCRYFISYGSGEISVFPKLSTPKLFLHFRIFSKDHARADTLQHAYNFRYTIARWKRQKYVNMVLSYFHRIYRKSMVYGYFFEYLPYPFLYVSSKYPLPILWSPYQMVFRVVYGMRGSLDRHVLCIAHFPLPSAGKLFIPVHRTGYSSFKNFIKGRRLHFGRIRQLQGCKEGGPEREKSENGRGHQDQGKQDGKMLASESPQGIAVKK